MTVRQIFCILIGLLTINLASEVQAGNPGEVIKTDRQAEGYVFPLTSKKRKPTARAEKILTGVFSAHDEVKVVKTGKELPDKLDFTDTQGEKRSKPKNGDTIAWITREGIAYHDPFLDCASGSERIWVSSINELSGLLPCEECFKKNNQAPGFISKESGGLDLASAAALLSNGDFLVWAQNRLPIRNPGFISSQKLMVYPKMEMTDNGLHQLAREIELAYRRHTWKVIEVIGKKSETDTGSVSSFDEVEAGDD